VNPRRVVHILGLLLLVLAAAQIVPLLWCLLPGEGAAAPGLLVGVATTATLALACRLGGTTTGDLYRRDGVLIVVGAWVLASITGAIPYLATGVITSPVDALFESASGFTTTGASILTDIEGVGHPMLLWRSFTQWLGGIGIVVLLVALLSELGPGARFLFKLEVPGPKAEILHDRVRQTAMALGRIYLSITAAQVVALLLFGLGPFDALTHTFSTVSTGGFSPHGDSIAHFSTPVRIIIMLFMIVAGVNFSHYYAWVSRGDLGALRDSELRLYLALLVLVSAIVAVDVSVHGIVAPGLDAIVEASFQVVSILTTTGFATVDFAEWPGVTQGLLVALMVVGGCAGSTAGGPKIVRLIIGGKAAMREVRLTYNPAAVIAISIGGRAVPEESVRGVVGLLLLWIVAWGVGTILLSVGDAGIVTAATASIATVSNIGPGLASVGPTESFAFFAPWQKLVMVFLMWLGRLEFFALLALLLPRFWRR
jgi:trk system potassium uptake protein TrkH